MIKILHKSSLYDILDEEVRLAILNEDLQKREQNTNKEITDSQSSVNLPQNRAKMRFNLYKLFARKGTSSGANTPKSNLNAPGI